MGPGNPPSPAPRDGAPRLPTIPGITLSREIARGGEGIVYAGRHDFLDREVAVKLLSVELSGEVFAARFRRAAKIMAGIKHPNIVGCYDAGTLPSGQSYLVMELIDGPNLKRWIASNGALSTSAALFVARRLTQALRYAHDSDIIHRDIKSENILLEAVQPGSPHPAAFPYNAKLVDLGLARAKAESATKGGNNIDLTMPGQAMGTPSTMAPEQFDDPDSVDFRADVYGLGCVMYEMLVGKAAFRSTRLTDLITMKRQPVGPNPCHATASIPTDVGALVSRLLSAEREARAGSYADLEKDLTRLLKIVQGARNPTSEILAPREQTLVVSMPQPEKQAGATTQRQQSRLPLVMGTVLVLGSAGGVAWWMQRETTPPVVNRAPILSPGLSIPAQAVVGESFEASVGANDPDGNTLSFRWSAPFAGERVEFTPNDRDTVRVTAREGVEGERLVLRVEVSDGQGGTDVRTGSIPLVVRQAPVVEVPKPIALEGIEGPPRIAVGTTFPLRAKVVDFTGQPSALRWSCPLARLIFTRKEGARVEALLVDGLAGEQFVVQVEANDGKNPPTSRELTLTVDEGRPATALLSDFVTAKRWQREGGKWAQLLDTPSSVSCRTEGGLRSASLTLENDTCWQLEGELESQMDEASRSYSLTGIRIESGQEAHAVVLSRSGEFGEEHLLRAIGLSRPGGDWVEQAVPGMGEVRWNSDQVGEDLLGSFTLRRVEDQLTLRIQQPSLKRSSEATLVLASPNEPTRIVLFVRDGRGAFRNVTLR